MLFRSRARHALLLLTFFTLGVALPLILLSKWSPDYFIFHPYPRAVLNFYCNPIILLFASGVLAGMVVDHFKFGLLTGKIIFYASLMFFTCYIFGLAIFPVNLITDIFIIVPMVTGAIICDMNGFYIFRFHKLSLLGDISYSLYLWHPLVVAYLRSSLEHLNVDYHEWRWMAFSGAMLLSVTIGWMSYHFFEMRALSLLKQRMQLSKKI